MGANLKSIPSLPVHTHLIFRDNMLLRLMFSSASDGRVTAFCDLPLRYMKPTFIQGLTFFT